MIAAEIRPDEISAILRKQLEEFDRSIEVYDVGTVLQVGDNVARVYGLQDVMASELVEFANGTVGMALNLEEDNVGVVLFGEDSGIKEGDEVRRTGRITSVPVGKQLLGRVINPLGVPLDGKGPIETDQYLPIERKAPGVITRRPVNVPLQTGHWQWIRSSISDLRTRKKLPGWGFSRCIVFTLLSGRKLQLLPVLWQHWKSTVRWTIPSLLSQQHPILLPRWGNTSGITGWMR